MGLGGSHRHENRVKQEDGGREPDIAEWRRRTCSRNRNHWRLLPDGKVHGLKNFRATPKESSFPRGKQRSVRRPSSPASPGSILDFSAESRSGCLPRRFPESLSLPRTDLEVP